MIKNLYRSLANYVNHRWGTAVFPLLFCVEAVFFMPVNVVLALFCLGRRNYSYLYALIATISSVIGAAIAYYLGALLFSSVGMWFIQTFSSMETFNHIIGWYCSYQSLAVLFASIAPVPFKLITLSAGFCHIPFGSFLLYVFIGRSMRFFTVAALTKAYGPQILEFTDKYFKYLAIGAIALIAAIYFFYKF